MTYFSKKDLYDDAFSLLSFANLKKTKLNYCPSIGKTEPVKTIPVNMNGAEIFELNRNIKQKCKQNADVWVFQKKQQAIITVEIGRVF